MDEVIGTGDLSKLGMLIGGLVLVYALQQLFQAGDMYVRHALGERFILDLRVRIYAYLQRLSLSFFERTSTGELMSRVTNDVNALESFVTHGSALTVVDLLRLVGGAVILFVLDRPFGPARALARADPGRIASLVQHAHPAHLPPCARPPG